MSAHHGFEEYLKVIYILRDEGIPPIAARVAEFLGVSAPTVSQMLRRLERNGYVTVAPSGAIALTEKGEAMAARVVRRHRLLERWLTDVLGLDWATADEEAGRLEHVLSEIVEERLDALLGHPPTCPHGNPIPGNGFHPAPDGLSLDRCAPGSRVIIERILERAEDIRPLLTYLADHGLFPGTELQVLEANPYAGSVIIAVKGHTTPIARETAEQIWVYPVR